MVVRYGLLVICLTAKVSIAGETFKSLWDPFDIGYIFMKTQIQIAKATIGIKGDIAFYLKGALTGHYIKN